MEKSWFIIAGKTPDLSLAEIKAQAKNFGVDENPQVDSKHCFSLLGEVPPTSFLERLGGMVRAGAWLAELDRSDLWSELTMRLEGSALPRLDFGISFIDANFSLKEIERKLLELKKTLRTETKKPVRVWIPQQGSELSAVVVQKQLLEKGGRELVVVKSGNQFKIGETKFVHQYEEWSHREFGKVAIDPRRGLLPHKLARMMLNLTGLNLGPEVTIYDPFCGSGVILLEAKELGAQGIGSDRDVDAVNDTRQNLPDAKIWVADATTVKIHESKTGSKQLAIVTEPALGPVWPQRPSSAEIKHTVQDLAALYRASLRHWRTFLTSKSPVVMVFPIIFGSPTYPLIVDDLSNLGYSTEVGPIRYEREGQSVTRDIVGLKAI